MTIDNWKQLKFWDSGEYQVIQEKLDEMDKAGVQYCPSRNNLFRALDETPFDSVKVAFIGQDPYPNPSFATGLAFSVPDTVQQDEFPASLQTIFKEYVNDLHLPLPSSGDLTQWCAEGVLLWNATPTCEAKKPASHRLWTEWNYLTEEIIKGLSERQGCVFCFVGSLARTFSRYVSEDGNGLLFVGHPSPRGLLRSNNPFLGSRCFSHINAEACRLGLEPIDWKL